MGWYHEYVAKKRKNFLPLGLRKKGDAYDLDSQSSGQVGEWEVDRGRDEIRLT